MHVASDNHYKLPGSDVDEGEDFEAALKPELLEGINIAQIQVVAR